MAPAPPPRPPAPASTPPRAPHLNPPQGLLVCIVVALFVMKPAEGPPRKEKPLTEQEIDELCEEWAPEPLEPPGAPPAPAPVVMTGPPLPHVTVGGGRSLVNLATSNFLGMSGRKDVEDRCAATVAKYGTGACGPRGFYGTLDVHLDLERRLARFLGTEECIIYSYDVATVSSVIPAFAKRQDVVVSDAGAHWAVQQGCLLSRAHGATFAHNDPADLERTIGDMERRLRGRPPFRRFLVVEGVYQDTGDICPLP